MLIDSVIFILFLLFSLIVFFINNIYFLLLFFVFLLSLCFVYKITIPLSKTFILILLINFILNLIFSNIYDSFIVSIRLFIMFLLVNIIIKKIGINNIGNIIGKIFHCKELSLIICISLSFIPILSREISDIKNSLYTKNFPLNGKNIFFRGHLFLICFFTNLFKKIDDMEKVLLVKGIDE